MWGAVFGAVCVCVRVWAWVCCGLGICAVCWERGEFCVCCVGVAEARVWVRLAGLLGVCLLCLFLPRCYPPRHLHPCNTRQQPMCNMPHGKDYGEGGLINFCHHSCKSCIGHGALMSGAGTS